MIHLRCMAFRLNANVDFAAENIDVEVNNAIASESMQKLVGCAASLKVNQQTTFAERRNCARSAL